MDILVLLSEGKWSKENNELFLYDPVLEYSFKGFGSI